MEDNKKDDRSLKNLRGMFWVLFIVVLITHGIAVWRIEDLKVRIQQLEQRTSPAVTSRMQVP